MQGGLRTSFLSRVVSTGLKRDAVVMERRLSRHNLDAGQPDFTRGHGTTRFSGELCLMSDHSQIVLTPSRTAAMCGMSTSFLARLRQSGEKRRHGLQDGPAFIRIGRKVMYRKSDIMTWILSLSDRPALPSMKKCEKRDETPGDACPQQVEG